jgi:hypothetical protein
MMEIPARSQRASYVLLVLRLLVISLLTGIVLAAQDVHLIDVAVHSLQLWRYVMQASAQAMVELASTIALGAIIVIPLWGLDRIVQRYFS